MSLKYFRFAPNTNYSLVFFVKNLFSTNVSRPLGLLISLSRSLPNCIVHHIARNIQYEKKTNIGFVAEDRETFNAKKNKYWVCDRRPRNIMAKAYLDSPQAWTSWTIPVRKKYNHSSRSQGQRRN